MRILFYTRNDFQVNTGGDTIQIIKTKEYLEKFGVEIDILSKNSIPNKDYNIIHVFNVIPINPIYDFFKRNPGTKVILSPIYWNMEEYRREVLDKVFVKRKLYNFVDNIPLLNHVVESRTISKITGINTNGMFEEKLHFCLSQSKLLLPNSEAERENLDQEFGLKNKCVIIPNGIDVNIIPSDPLKIAKKFKLPEDFILCAGRIEYRKNQLELLKAAKKLRINVVLVGKISDAEKKYFDHFQNYNFIHIPSLSQPELFSLYSICKAHVLPSWFETPGLASLEAAYHGTQVVTTDRGCTKEYFEDNVFYCDPGDSESIEKAISESLNHPKDTRKLIERIKDNYTWEKAAQKTLAAYNSIL